MIKLRLDRYHIGRYDPQSIYLARQIAEKSKNKSELSKVIRYCKPHVETDDELRAIHSTALKALAEIGGNIGWPDQHLPRIWKENTPDE